MKIFFSELVLTRPLWLRMSLSLSGYTLYKFRLSYITRLNAISLIWENVFYNEQKSALWKVNGNIFVFQPFVSLFRTTTNTNEPIFVTFVFRTVEGSIRLISHHFATIPNIEKMSWSEPLLWKLIPTFTNCFETRNVKIFIRISKE